MAADPRDACLENRPRYYEVLHNVPKAMAELMSSYSGIPKNEQIAHITKLRNEAYAQFPYPCMGTFRFLDLDLARHEAYKEHVLGPLCQPAVPSKPEPLFLDCGCCLGQDVRKLAVDGVPPNRLWASDIEPSFIESGFELFRDGDKLPRDHFLCPANVFSDTEDPSEDPLVILNDRVTILNISAVFHLFDLDQHRRIANRCLKLLRKDTGAPVLVLGAHVGSHKPERHRRRPGVDEYRYTHNQGSWEALWREVCEQPQWKDKVVALEVKAKLFERLRNEDPSADEVVTLREADVNSDSRPWQMWEVWVTFKSIKSSS
ncbi:hypothetical protein F5Y09DRAFT_319844 [Xylaria sp. FL1042]|nr:hypothetical protein F5Y09DRAFT_319844 [Xylaria sp. FL1042]